MQPESHRAARITVKDVVGRTALLLFTTAVDACSLFQYEPPRPDATGVVRISCSRPAQSSMDAMAQCDQDAREACDGPALELESSFSSTPPDLKTGQVPLGAMDYGTVRYQCTPR